MRDEKYIFSFLSLIFIIFSSNQSKINGLIVLPFNIKIKNENDDEFFSKYLSTKFEIGVPPQNIEAEINFQESDFFLCYTRKHISLSYNKSKSNTYRNTTLYRISTKNFIAGCRATETFYFYNDEKLVRKQKYENIPFFMSTNSDKLFGGILGFEYSDKGLRGFVASLKNAKVINSYTWTLKFNSNDEGLLIIGEEPHLYSNSYDGNKLKYTKLYLYQNLFSWSIYFNSILTGELIDKNYLIGIIRPDIKGFISPEKYFENLYAIFFRKYFNDKICEKIEIIDKNISNNDYYDEQVMKFYKIQCDKNKFSINDIKLFPSLKFMSITLNYTFIFEGKDLFYENNEKYIFQIYISDIKYWILGRIFLYKYQLIFNEDNKLIGFYTDMNASNSNNRNGLIFFEIIIIIIVSIFSLFLLFILYKKIRLINKIKNYANELEEDFSYKKNDNENYKDNKGNLLFENNI